MYLFVIFVSIYLPYYFQFSSLKMMDLLPFFLSASLFDSISYTTRIHFERGSLNFLIRFA